MPDIDAIKKPAKKRSKKDTSPRKKALAKSAHPETFYNRKAAKTKQKAATAK